MRSTELVKLIKTSEKYQPFNASEFYKKIDLEYSELSFYKALERLVKSQSLIKVSKGVYCLPIHTDFGVVKPSNKQIIEKYISKTKGMKIGYQLYNELNLSTQISKKYLIYSNALSGFTKNIENINIKKVELSFTEEIKNQIAMMEILSNFETIQDLNLTAFRSYSEKFAKTFNEKCFEDVIKNISYKKSTIAFLREILNYFNKSNNLGRYLSSLSTYKYPKMEEIYESSSR